jgi:hypothetical protein
VNRRGMTLGPIPCPSCDRLSDHHVVGLNAAQSFECRFCGSSFEARETWEVWSAVIRILSDEEERLRRAQQEWKRRRGRWIAELRTDRARRDMRDSQWSFHAGVKQR